MSAAWFFAASPIKRSPSLKATTDGVMRLPWSLAMISTRPLTYTPTHCGSGNILSPAVADWRDLRAASTGGELPHRVRGAQVNADDGAHRLVSQGGPHYHGGSQQLRQHWKQLGGSCYGTRREAALRAAPSMPGCCRDQHRPSVVIFVILELQQLVESLGRMVRS